MPLKTNILAGIIAGLGAQRFPALSSLNVFGDSITEGTAATTVAGRWCNIAATALGVNTATSAFNNAGIGGTVLQNSNGSGGTPLGNNGRDRFVAALLGANKRDGVFVNYGFNDARYTAAPATFNVTEYQKDLSQVIAGLIEGGYDTNKILITTPYYITDTGLNTGTAGFTGQTRSGFTAFVDAAKAVALEYGVWCYDSYAYMLANGAGSLISGDNIHPGDTGHAAIAAGMLASSSKLNTIPKLAFTSSRATSTTANYSITAPSGSVTNYTIEYALDGTFDYGNAVTVTDLSGTVTIPTGACRVRVRANFSDTTKSPWAIGSYIADATAFVYDSFTDTDGIAITSHTPELGGDWSAQSGYAPASPSLLASGRVYSQTNAGAYANAANPPSADYYVEAIIDVMSDLTGDVIGVGARYQPGAKTGYFARFSKATSNWRLFKEVAGATTQLGAAISSTGANGPYVLRLTCSGSTITASLNGVDFATATDTAIAAAGKALIMDLAAKTPTTGRQITSFKAVGL